MSAHLRASIAGLGAIALLAGCGSSGSGGAGGTTSTSATTTRTVATTTSVRSTTRVEITVSGGTAEGGITRISVDKGAKVVLVVHADVSDEVHLHGYDLHGDVTPSKSARIAFTASVPGRFEVELESRGLQIAELEVGA